MNEFETKTIKKAIATELIASISVVNEKIGECIENGLELNLSVDQNGINAHVTDKEND